MTVEVASISGPRAGPQSRSTDWRAVILLSFGFGLVGLDRFMILPMFPVIARSLSLGPADLGMITGALAITWGIAALLFGEMADRFGRKRTVICAMLGFSLLVGVSGLAEGLLTLVLLRALMGFAEGAFITPGIGVTAEVTSPRHLSIALGIQQMSISLFGLALAPIFVTMMMTVVDWRLVFLLVSVPGFLVAALLARYLRDGPALAPSVARAGKVSLKTLLSYHNVRVGMLLMLAGLIALVVIGALLPSYLTSALRLDYSTMGWVLSASGFGAVSGAIPMLMLSDRIGRARTAGLCSAGAVIAIMLMAITGPAPLILFAELFAISFFAISMIALADGPIAVEAVPPALAASAAGAIIAAGEILGGGIAPMLAGWIIERTSLAAVFPLAAVGAGLGLVAALMLKEPFREGAERQLGPSNPLPLTKSGS